MAQTQFEIKSLPGVAFRPGKISPVSLLAITTQIDFDRLEQTEVLFTFALENLEVKQGESWVPVKVKGRDVYMPIDIENNFVALNELIGWFLTEVVAETFPKSSE